MNFFKLTIKEIIKETTDAVSIVFNIPESLQQQYTFVAGQYVTIQLQLDGKPLRRAYSISSTPNSQRLQISVKAVKNGLFSTFATTSLKVGDLLEVSIPEGKFTFSPDTSKQKNYALWAAGSGITPVFSILKTILEEEPNSSVVLTYGNKNPESTIFLEELKQLQQKYIHRFFVHFVYSNAHTENSFFGRIDSSVVNAVLKNKHADITFGKHYICGPEEMINSISTLLKSQNVAEKDIKFELFGTAPTQDSIATNTEGNSQITVVVDGDVQNFEMSTQQTILEAALKKGIDVPYSCQGGICSSCICKITSGSATMKKNQILTDAEIADGLVLACQAVPTSSEIVANFDDV